MQRVNPTDAVINRLVGFLKAHYPADVLMPVPQGEKFPMFPHRDGVWTWDRFDGFIREDAQLPFYKRSDLCVVLRDLCVVDVDSMAQAIALEARFPCLRDAPCEATQRGRHYWFERPQEADLLGYYDGGGQVERGVDFKSVCSTGTSGVVVVALNRGGRTWLRPLTADAVKPMPIDLLAAVAEARHDRVLSLVMRFEDDDEPPLRVVGPCARWVQVMQYFEPLLGDAEGMLAGTGADMVVPVPVKRAMFLATLHTLQHGQLPLGHAISTAADVVECADKLGAPTRRLRLSAESGLLHMLAEWRRMHEDEFMCHARERAVLGCPSSGSEEARLVEVGAELATNLVYHPPSLDPAAKLFPNARPPPGIDAACPLLAPDPSAAVWAACPPVVRELLRIHPGNLVLAGGAVLGAVARQGTGVPLGSDFDLFIVGLDGEGADALVAGALEQVGGAFHCTGNAFTLASAAGLAVQIVRRLYPSRAHVLSSFDVAPSRILAYFDAERAQLVVEAAPSWEIAMRQRAFPVDVRMWSSTSTIRVIKYVAKGFDAYLPGLRRDLLCPDAPDSGIGGLVRAEGIITRNRGACERPDLCDLPIIMHTLGCGRASDYGLVLKLQGRIRYVVNALILAGRSLMGLSPPSQPSRPDGGWPLCTSLERVVFHPRDALAGAFDHGKMLKGC